MDLRLFRIVNNLTQAQLGEYLGIKKPYLSRIENGRDELPTKHLHKLLNNDKGWDIGPLSSDGESLNITQNFQSSTGNNSSVINHSNGNGEVAAYRAQVELLKAQLAEAKELNERYWSLIQKLTK